MKRFTDLEKKYVLDVIDNEFATSKNSIYNNKLEKQFAEMFDAKFAIGHCNGTATLHVALMAVGIQPGDEVIVPALTMSSTSIPVVLCGAIPVFADSDLDTFQISPESIEKCITSKTKAIISVSLFGLAPDYDKICAICKKHNLALIEDNAECFLGTYKGKLVGQFGDISSYSFQASKHLTTGEGGILITNSEELADKIRRLNCLGYAGVSAKQGKITRNDIQDPNYSRHISFGYNYRMSELQAAVACGQLERAEELVQNRIEVAKIFDEVIKGQTLLKRQAEPEGYKIHIGHIAWYLIPINLRWIGTASVTSSRKMVVMATMQLGSSLTTNLHTRTFFSLRRVYGRNSIQIFVLMLNTFRSVSSSSKLTIGILMKHVSRRRFLRKL